MPRPRAWDTSFQEIYNGPPLSSTQDLQIPDYQRMYTWPRPMVEQLFDDLSEYRQETAIGAIPNSPYYLGNIVIHDSPPQWDIVDGQQRITALTLLTVALRDVALNNEFWEIGMNIQNSLISSTIWNGHYLSAKCEDPLGNWAHIEKHENRAIVRFFQNLDKDHVEFEVEYNGPAEGPTGGAINTTIEIAPNTAHYAITPGAAAGATHPEISFGNNVTFKLQHKDHGFHGGIIDINPGDAIQHIVGTLNIPAGQALNPGDIGKVKPISDQQSWWAGHYGGVPGRPKNSWRLPLAYSKLKLRFENEVDAAVARADKINLLNHWFDVLKHTAFTITMFDDLEAAIFHFEKMNDKSYSLSLDAGDLMRREKVVRSRKAKEDADNAGVLLHAGAPADLLAASDDIDAAWAVVQDELVTGEFNEIGNFLRSMHISIGNNITASKTFREHRNALNNGIPIARAAIAAPIAGAGGAVADQYEVDKNQAAHVLVKKYFEGFSTLAPIYREIRRPDVTAIAEPHRIELSNLTRAGFKQHWPLLLRGKYVIDRGKVAAAPAGVAVGAWDALFPRLIRIYEYLIIRGVIFPADILGGGIASNVIWARIAEWCDNLIALPQPAPLADIQAKLNTISADVVTMCSGYRWRDPTYTALVAAHIAATTAAGVAGAAPANIEAAVSTVPTGDSADAAAKIVDLAADAAREPTTADALALVAAAVPAAPSIDLRYLDMQVNTNQACMLLSTIEITRRGVTWAASAAAGGTLFQTKKDVEHILPRNAQTGVAEPWGTWNGVTDDEIKSYKNRLGNLTLLNDSANRALQRKSFVDKQTEAGNGYTDKANLTPVTGEWCLLDELVAGTQVGWLQVDIDTRTENLLNELFVIYDPDP